MNAKSLLTAAAVFLTVLSSCSPEAPSPSSGSSSPAAIEEQVPGVGERDPQGHLVFWHMDAYDHIAPFVLSEDCGVLLLNEGDESAPVPRYILAVQATGRIFDTKDFEDFKRKLETLPAGSTIGRYETCSMPRCYGLTELQMRDFLQAIQRGGGTAKPVEHTVCYCPNKS